MVPKANKQRRHIVAPLLAFILVLGVHFAWGALFPEQDPAQAGWAVLPEEFSYVQAYLESQGYWLGYSYGLSAAFAAAAVVRFLANPCRAGRGFALAGVSFSGLLALAGCFLIGCCGSPMLVVWLNLFGAAFLPFAKPILAGLTTMTIALSWWWMIRQTPEQPSLQTVESIVHYN